VGVGEADLEREQDIEELRRIALAQHAQIQQLIRQLQRKCDTLSFYTGNKDELQQTLALIEKLTEQATRAAAAAKKPTPRPPAKKPDRSGPTEQPRLPLVVEHFELDTADRACPSCGVELFAMKGQCETSEMIDVVEVNYRVVQVEQQEYVCRCGGCVETAPGPERVAPGSRYSLALAIKVVLDKYLDHIPLERQVRIMDRHGLVITSQTLWDLANALARRLERVDAALFAHVVAHPVIGLDQTGWPRLDGSATKPWQMWCLTAPGVVVHRIRDDKSAALRSPPRCTRCSRPRSCTTSIPPRMYGPPSSLPTEARCCCPGSSPPRATCRLLRSKSRGVHHTRRPHVRTGQREMLRQGQVESFHHREDSRHRSDIPTFVRSRRNRAPASFDHFTYRRPERRERIRTHLRSSYFL
jgi:transposase